MTIVDNGQPGPAKREIKLLKRIEDINLSEKFNIPRVIGPVYGSENSGQMIGFVQTNIKMPIPLVKLLDKDISQHKRERWAKEVDRIKELLHDNDSVHGDMKADNFLVDEDDQLWITDFGGSLTEGWINPDLMETEECDIMGAERSLMRCMI
jgi:serine/threonine protein kinase